MCERNWCVLADNQAVSRGILQKGKRKSKNNRPKKFGLLAKSGICRKGKKPTIKTPEFFPPKFDIQHAGLRCNKFVYAPSSSFRNLSPDRVVFLVCVYRDRSREGANAVRWLRSQPKDNKDLRLSRDISIRLPTPQNKDLKEKEKKQENDAKIGNSVLTTELKT